MQNDVFTPCSKVLRCLKAFAAEEAAQGTLEYALATMAILSIVLGIAAIWRAAEAGVLARLVERATSHVLGGSGLFDIALY
ncbi:hypothetical protein K6V98_02445 [Collinsella sp. AGMB00827]|uniref:DUF4244 domain-containing protein n=1 Tax=Collinsella ureilytica TaxID=2869515 RepID=A0ABS7MLG1_9ACTN|nr:hypothetical protein [Collinsella urealyticum]MBY4797225.1 hypothetical protein [Collinsella urealyticum]